MQYVSPNVSKKKFDQEIDLLNGSMDIQRKRGIIVLKIEYPNVFIAFSVVKLKPVPIAFAVQINFDNYDFEPLSVTFVNPFTLKPVCDIKEIGCQFPRPIPNSSQLTTLLQQDEGRPPFICLPGFREYHNHPFHNGDAWLLHKDIGGEGTLGYIIDKLYEYGISSIASFYAQVQVPVNMIGMGLSYDVKNLPI